MVVCHPNPPADHFQDHPVVIIKILGDSTRRQPEGGFAASSLTGADAIIPLPELYGRAGSQGTSVTLRRAKLSPGFGKV
jgi:hypothetical protein